MREAEQTLEDGRILSIRVAKAADATAVLKHLEAVSGETDYLSFGAGEFDMTLEEETAYLESSRLVDNRLCLLGRVDGSIVAALTYDGGRRPRTRHTGELGISVRESHWGLGIGAHLMDALIDWAVANEAVTKINLRVRVDNERAIRLYECKGFEVEGTIRRDLYVNGTYYNHLTMGLLV